MFIYANLLLDFYLIFKLYTSGFGVGKVVALILRPSRVIAKEAKFVPTADISDAQHKEYEFGETQNRRYSLLRTVRNC